MPWEWCTHQKVGKVEEGLEAWWLSGRGGVKGVVERGKVRGAAGVASIFGTQNKQRVVRPWSELLRVKHTPRHTLSLSLSQSHPHTHTYQ